MELVIGIEPTTCWLQVSYSTVESHQHINLPSIRQNRYNCIIFFYNKQKQQTSLLTLSASSGFLVYSNLKKYTHIRFVFLLEVKIVPLKSSNVVVRFFLVLSLRTILARLLAERVGFEPTVRLRITGFQDQLLKPLGHLSINNTN